MPRAVQVFAAHATLGTAFSERRPVHANVAEDTKLDPMGTSLVEHHAVATPWSLIAHALFYGLLCSHICLLMLARVLRNHLVPLQVHMHDPIVASRNLNGPDTDSEGAVHMHERQVYNTGDDQIEGAAPVDHDHTATVARRESVATGGVVSLQSGACSTTCAVRHHNLMHEPPASSMHAARAAAAHVVRAAVVVVMAPLRQHAEFARWERGWSCLLGYLVWLGLGPMAVLQPIEHSSATLALPF